MPAFSKASLKKRYEFLIKESDYSVLEGADKKHSEHFYWKQYVYERLRDAVSQAVVFFVEYTPAPATNTEWLYARPTSMPFKNMIVVFTDEQGNFTYSFHYLNFYAVHVWDITLFDDVSNYRMESFLHWIEAAPDGSFSQEQTTQLAYFSPAKGRLNYKGLDVSHSVFSLFDNLSSQSSPYIPVTNKNKKVREGRVGNLAKFIRINQHPTMGVRTGQTRDYQPRRDHEVRGHWRRFANGNKTWVKSHRRGDDALGTIKKTYILEAAQ